MNKFSKYVCMLGLVIAATFFNPMRGLAQPDPSCDPLDPACPIDGGLSLLIAAGVGLGAKKAYDRKKRTTNL